MARSADTRGESNRGTPSGVQPAGHQSSLTIALFVYGTLKRGHSNHDGYCRGVPAIEPAVVRGCVYTRPDRIPFLKVPDRDILAIGTADPSADAATQERFTRLMAAQQPAARPPCPKETGEGVVHGELLVFNDPETRLPAIDRLEGFRPGGRSLYRRVLVPVLVNRTWQVAWAYAIEKIPPEWPRLESGCWTG